MCGSNASDVVEEKSPIGRSSQQNALWRILICGASLGLSWLAMQTVHELGHVLAAEFTGGHVQRVVLHPLSISRTDVLPNPAPRLVVWAGPAVGVVLPVSAWWIVRRRSWSYLLRFFAGFCLVANGAYLGAAPLQAVGDAAALVKLGTPPRLLAIIGVTACAAGLSLWNGLGPAFGSGGRPVVRFHALSVALLFTLAVAALLILDTR